MNTSHKMHIRCDKNSTHKMNKFYLLYSARLRPCQACDLESWLVIWALRQNQCYPPISLDRLVRASSRLVCVFGTNRRNIKLKTKYLRFIKILWHSLEITCRRENARRKKYGTKQRRIFIHLYLCETVKKCNKWFK